MRVDEGRESNRRSEKCYDNTAKSFPTSRIPRTLQVK